MPISGSRSSPGLLDEADHAAAEAHSPAPPEKSEAAGEVYHQSETPEHREHQEAIEQVANWVEEACGLGKNHELKNWYQGFGEEYHAIDHVAAVYSKSGISDVVGRLDMVRVALQHQQQLRRERRRQKERPPASGALAAEEPTVSLAPPRKKMVDRMGNTGVRVEEVPVVHSYRRRSTGVGGADVMPQTETSPPAEHAAGDATAAEGDRDVAAGARLSKASTKCDFAAVDESLDKDEEPEQVWTKVQGFKTQEEALQFIMECQPMDYRPVAKHPDDNPDWRRFDTRLEAYHYARNLRPFPNEFVTEDNTLRRRLRIRRDELREKSLLPDTTKPARARNRRPMVRNSLTMSGNKGPMELKLWIVESFGNLFEMPTAAMLRTSNHRPNGRKYFLAIAPDIERKVLTEGYEVKRRSSIPCCSTPQAASAAFVRSQPLVEGDAPVTPVVLEVRLPPDCTLNVVAHSEKDKEGNRVIQEGCFIIREKKLPVSFLSKVRGGYSCDIAGLT